jgi:hypothetical protein
MGQVSGNFELFPEELAIAGVVFWKNGSTA